MGSDVLHLSAPLSALNGVTNGSSLSVLPVPTEEVVRSATLVKEDGIGTGVGVGACVGMGTIGATGVGVGVPGVGVGVAEGGRGIGVGVGVGVGVGLGGAGANIELRLLLTSRVTRADLLPPRSRIVTSTLPALRDVMTPSSLIVIIELFELSKIAFVGSMPADAAVAAIPGIIAACVSKPMVSGFIPAPAPTTLTRTLAV